MPKIETRIHFKNNEEALMLLGAGDEQLKFWEEILDVHFRLRGDQLIITGEKEDVARIEAVIHKALANLSQFPPEERSEYLMRLLKGEEEKSITISVTGKKVQPLSSGQRKYVETIEQSDITFCIGPAGTGKTFLAVACAIEFLKGHRGARIILCRPAVEAGESLGFLPGDIRAKINPYLRPLYDALYEILGPEKTMRLLEKEIVEIAPLAYMRGRTLSNAFIILDEAQNVKKLQMKMFLTRIGIGSKAVITGDITQIDLPRREDSGLIHAMRVLRDIPGVGFAELSHTDVVRHPVVARIILAYQEREESG
ncbi:MAG: PhoH family protein [bacterium]